MQNNLRQQLFEAYEADELATVVVLGEILLSQNPADGAVLYRLGDALAAMAQYELGERYLKAALELAPAENRDVVYWRLGLLHQRRGEFAKAADYFAAAAEVAPDDAMYWVFQGSMLAKLGRLEDAEAMQRRATLCSEGDVDEAYLNLGLLYRSQRRLAEARDCLELALEIDPEYAVAKKVLKDVQRAMQISGDEAS